MNTSSFRAFILLVLILPGCSKAPIGKWMLEGQFPIELTIYPTRMDARWLHSDKTLSFTGKIKDDTFLGHITLDPSLPDNNLITFLSDGSLEAHFLKKPNVIFKRKTEQGAAANP